MTQPAEQRLVVEAKIGVPGTVANNAVVAAAQTALATDTTVKGAAATAVTTEVTARGLISDSDPRIPRNAATEVGEIEYLEAWADKTGRAALGVTDDGHAHAPILDSELATIETVNAEFSNVQEQTLGGEQVTNVMDAEKYLYAMVDLLGRESEFLLDFTGKVPQHVLDAWAARMGVGALAGLASAFPISAWGDSQTGQTFDGQKGWVDEFARVLGLTQSDKVINRGFPGETSVAIAAKSGAVPAVWTAGGTIPADGPVTMILRDHVDLMKWWAPMPCTLGGVHGTLTRHPDGGGAPTLEHPATFTRDVAGAAVVVPPNAPLISDWAELYRSCMTIIMSGRNNGGAGTVDRVVADTRAQVEFLTGLDGKYLVLSQINGTYRDGINAANKLAYGPRYIDVLAYLASTKALADAGITPTSQDLTDIAAGNIPTSFYADGTHLNGVGLITMGRYMAQIVIGKVWLT